MFMRDDKKNIATMIISKLKKQPEKTVEAPKQDGAEIADPDAKDVAMDEFVMSLEKKDLRGMKDALQSFVSMCMDEYEESEIED